MYDILEDQTSVSIILSKRGKLTLQDVVDSFDSTCPEELAHSTIARLVKIMCRIHKSNVMHRNICPTAIGMAPTDGYGGFKVIKMGGFDFACCTLSCGPIPSSVLSDKKRALMAPEIEAGLAHDASADVWSLGQLAYQLMSSEPSSQKPHYLIKGEPNAWLPEVTYESIDLVEAMVSQNPKDRPTM